MKIHFIPVTDKNRKGVLSLQILPEQRGYIESVEQCLAEAGCIRNWRPVGVYDGNRLVGFTMYGFFLREYPPFGRLWMDRFLIDRRCQGQGYGRESLRLLLERLEKEYPLRDVFLSVVAGNAPAVRLYQSFGFRFTGEKDVHGEDVMRRAGRRFFQKI